MNPISRPRLSRQPGFTLIEILVGMAIGMLLTVVILQVMSVFDNQRRITSGTADAQTNGNIALYTITREMQSAGYGLFPAALSPQECTTLNVNGVADATTPNRLTPVAITNGATAVGDTLTIRFSNGGMGGIPTTINSVGSPTANDVVAGTNFACAVGDISLITNGSTCAMSTVTALTANNSVRLTNVSSAVVGANLTCLGTWTEVTYRVNNSNLERNGIPILPGIVSLQAQYGIAANAKSNEITQWVDATGATWAAPTPGDRNRIKAIRLAIVGRNDKIEGADVTSACSSTTTASPTGLCAWEGSSTSPAPAINLTADAQWRKYRYRVMDTVIPLRNVIWAKSTL